MNDLPLAGLGHNLPPEPIDVDAEIQELIANANRWAERYPVVETEEVAELALDNLDKLKAHRAQYEALRKEEKRPFDEGAKAVQQKWLPRLERLDACLEVFDSLRVGWLRLKDARLRAQREAAEREAAEAQRQADQLAEQAKAGGHGTVTNLINATEATQEAERKRQVAAAIPRRAQASGALGGRTHSLRTVWLANVVSIEKAFEHYKARKEVKELLNRLANADARAGIKKIPGCYVWSEEN